MLFFGYGIIFLGLYSICNTFPVNGDGLCAFGTKIAFVFLALLYSFGILTFLFIVGINP